MEGLEAHAGDAELAELGAAALANLTPNCGVQSRAMAAGAFRALVAAMRTHTETAGVQARTPSPSAAAARLRDTGAWGI